MADAKFDNLTINNNASFAGNVGIGTPSPNAANKLQVEGPIHTDGNPIYLRQDPTDKFDVVRWDSKTDRVAIGGYHGVNLCATGGGGGPVMKTVLSVDENGNFVVNDPTQHAALVFNGKEAMLAIGCPTNYGDLAVLGMGGIHRLRVNGASGEVVMRDENNNVAVTISSSPGNVVLAGADCAERFDIVPTMDHDPGTLLIIAPDGRLTPCTCAYDKRVAGVVSGAGGLRPGMVLNGFGGCNGSVPVALVGRVFVKADARCGAIEVGDLLTSSDTPGHAMKASDVLRTPGTVIGKALAPLADGKGMIPIIVSLQ
jgi:hypothetical protein